jgi:hypothetical protein
MIKKIITVTILEDVVDLDLPPTAAETDIISAINTACLNLGYSETEYLPPEINTDKQLISTESETEVILTSINIVTNVGD